MMTDNDKTSAASLIKSRVDWSRYPKLADIFQRRPSVNIYWHELVEFCLFALENDENSVLRNPPRGTSATIVELVPHLLHTQDAVARRHAWHGDGGHPAGEGVIIAEPKDHPGTFWKDPEYAFNKQFVWSRDRSIYKFTPDDMLAKDWYLSEPL